MRNKHGLEVRHVVTLDDTGVELQRYLGVPRHQIMVEGSFTPENWWVLRAHLDQWASDPAAFWIPVEEKAP